MRFKSKARADIAVRCVEFLISSLFNANYRVTSDRSDGAGEASAAAAEQEYRPVACGVNESQVSAVTTRTERIC